MAASYMLFAVGDLSPPPPFYLHRHTYFLRPLNEVTKMPQTHSYTFFYFYSSVPAIKTRLQALQTPVDCSHPHLTCFMSFHHLSDFWLAIINVFLIVFFVDVQFTVSSWNVQFDEHIYHFIEACQIKQMPT